MVEVPTQKVVEIDYKPSVEPIDYLLEAWSIARDSLLFVGDSDVDQLLALRAEVAFSRIPEVARDDISLLTFLYSRNEY